MKNNKLESENIPQNVNVDSGLKALEVPRLDRLPESPVNPVCSSK
jgi:hypothetical protein